MLAGSCGLAGAQAGADEALVQAIAAARERGCQGRAGVRAPLRTEPRLAEAARRIAAGEPALQAMRQAGFRAKSFAQVQLNGYPSPAAVAGALAARYCEPLTNPALSAMGLHRRGTSYWIVLAAPFHPPAPSQARDVAAQVLALSNQARSQPRRCGNRSFAAAPPLQADARLDRAAAVHAQDMARHGYLGHRGRDGSGADRRVTRAGYAWRSVGENIASGQQTAREVVRDWLASPTHCANLMSPRFTQMGIAYAVNPASPDGSYWAQVLARPR
ncbi:conserved hypothetical protein [Ramlibacter tataouinensis TTB310]|uniref:SCP domain-containing protein n=1 Tax=Ramlibacter tataouinensis (strain ATCC BAA-407 / DSM 14655 / LMG 21543 / TTB310) TaxID=365046 RepID=F5Y3G5_RAMTT|nr:conserved hypothetical protein [Ramlibacter tataouinensis TTB310]